MRPRRTINSTRVFRLPGGNEDTDLWAYDLPDTEGGNVICSVWVPEDDERKAIANGENIRLMVWGSTTPPISMGLTDEALGRKKEE